MPTRQNRKTQWPIAFTLIILVLAGVFLLTGCKKKPESTEPTETTEVVSEAIEQKTCPVMGGAINKDIFTEYKGKKVYFCCGGCKDKFNAKPEDYVAKLPQFE